MGNNPGLDSIVAAAKPLGVASAVKSPQLSAFNQALLKIVMGVGPPAPGPIIGVNPPGPIIGAPGLAGGGGGLAVVPPAGPQTGPIAPTDPKTVKLFSQNNQLQNEVANLGATPTHGHPDLFHQVLDLASRPEYAVANAVKKTEADAFEGKSILQQLRDVGTGALGGFEGKDKTLATDVIQQSRDILHQTGGSIADLALGKLHGSTITPGEAGPMKSVLGRVIGAAANAVADPTSYVGVGPVKDLAKQAAELIKSGATAEKVAPYLEDIAKATGRPVEDIRATILGPQITAEGKAGIPTAVKPELAAEGARQGNILLNQTKQGLEKQSLNQAAKDFAAKGRAAVPIPAPIRKVDWSNTVKVKAGWARSVSARAVKEARDGEAHAVRLPHNLTRAGYIKAVHDARIAGDTEKVQNLLRDPSTGESLLKGAARKNADAGFAYDKHFALLNHGAKNPAAYAAFKAAHDIKLKSSDPAIVKLRRDGNAAAAKAHAIDQVAVSHSKIAGAAAHIGTDMSKLDVMPKIKGAVNPYTGHLATLPNTLAAKASELRRPLTPVETQALTDHWWGQMHRGYAQFMEKVAQTSHNFPSLADYVDAHTAAASVKKGVELGPTSREAQFAKAEHAAIKAQREAISKESRASNAGVRENLASINAGREASKLEPNTTHMDFMPRRIDPTESFRVIQQNQALAKEIAAHAAEQSATQYKDIETAVQAAMRTAYAPEEIKRLSLTMGLGKNRVTLLKSPEFASQFIKKFVEGNQVVNKTLHAFDHWFVSTGKMLPEIAGLKASSEGMVHQLSRRMTMRIQSEFRGVSHGQAMDAFTSYVKGVAHPNSELTKVIANHFDESVKILRDPEMSKLGVTLAKINGMIGDHFKLENLPSGAQLGRVLESDAATNKMLRNLVADGITKGKIKDPASFLSAFNIGQYRAIFAGKIRDSIQQGFGVSMRDGLTGGKSEAAQALIDNHGFRPLKAKSESGITISEAKDLKNYVFDPKIADDVNRMLELIHDNHSVEQLSGFLDRAVLQPWRAATTVYNIPSYTFRNGMQNFYMVWLALRHTGSDMASMGHSYALSAKWLKEAPPEDLKFATDPLHTAIHGPVGEGNAATTRMFRAVGPNGHNLHDLNSEFVTLRNLEGAFLANGLDTGFFTTQFGNSARAAGKVKELAGRVNNFMSNANKVAENYHRKALFIDAIKHSTKDTFEERAFEAASTVRKFLFDYHDLTGAEKAVMTRIFPFYKWTRKAFPLMVESMFLQPGKVFGITKAQYTLTGQQQPNNPWINNVEAVLPDWLKFGTEKIPFGHHGGNQLYGTLPLPFNDLGDQFGGDTSGNPAMGFLNGAASMVNPVARVPLELVTGHQVYHQLPIKNPAQYATVGQFPEWTKFQSLLQAMQPSNQGSKATQGAGKKNSLLYSALKDSGLAELSENTPTGQRSQLTAQNQKLQAQRKKLLTAIQKGP